MFTIVMFVAANPFVVTANYMFFTSKSLKGILGTSQLNKYALGEGIQEGLWAWKNVYKNTSIIFVMDFSL